MAEESKKLSFNPETGKWENIPEEEKIRNNKNFKVGGKTVAVLYTYKPFWSVYDTVLLVADGKEAHYTVTPYQRYVDFSKADNQEYDYYGAIANQRVRYDLALRNPELVPRYEDNIFGLGIQPVFDDVEMAKDYAERTRNKIVATPKEILGNYFVFLNKPQAEYTRNDYITMEDYPIPNMFNNITYRVPVYLTSQADMFSVVDTLKDEGYDIKGDGVKIVWYIDFDKEENAKNFARRLHDLMVDNSKLSKPYSDLLDLFRNPNPKIDEQLYRRIDTMEEYTKSMSRYRDGAFDATLEGKNIFTLDRITKDLPQTEIASVRYDNGKITFAGKDGNTYRLEHLSEESIKNLINIERNIIESEERARSPKDIPYYYSVFDLTEDYMKEEYDKASVTDDKARFLELAKEADWDYNLSTDLIYKSPLRKEGDEIIAKDNKYTVVYNKNNGESYHIYRNITEQDVRDLIISSSSKLDLGDNPTADVKNLASLMEKEKAVNETNVTPEKVSFDNKEDLKAYITDYCEKHGWDSDLNHIDVSKITDMSELFMYTEFNGDISEWDVSNVTDMSEMFAFSDFNGDISKWNVSNVTDMSEMFALNVFNGDISNWNVSNVKDMSVMFYRTPFNQPINDWDVSNVKNMTAMFSHSKFDQPINSWDTGHVTNMSWMFAKTPFNQPLDKWDVSNVKDMSYMFKLSSFNQPIDKWDTSKVEDMSWMFADNKALEKMPDWKLSPSVVLEDMFAGTKFEGQEESLKRSIPEKVSFDNKEALKAYITDYCNNHGWDSDLNHIDVSKITDMSGLFMFTKFNGDISKWDVSNVKDMSQMFYNSKFNQPLDKWNTGNVKTMERMFYDSNFNHPLDNWNVSKVENMSYMFKLSSFNQPIDNWDVSNVKDMSYMFEDNKALEKMPDWKLDPSIITKYMFAETKFSGKEFQYKVEDNSKIKFLHKEDLNNYIFDYCNKHGWDSDLNHIDVSGITDMSYLFYSTTFTGDISKWNTSNVVNMNSMFSYSQFNGDISNWDVSKVKDMRFMFEESPFSQSLDKWDMSNVRDVSHMFANTPLEGKELKLKNNTHMESRSYTLPEEKEQGMAKEPSAATTVSDLYSPEAVVARIKARISASMKTGNIPLSSLTTAVATKFKQLYSDARNLTTTSDTREVSLDVDCRYAFDKALAYASKHDGKWLNIKDNAYPITIPFNSPLTHYGAVLSALTSQEKGYATNVFCGAESLKQMGIELKKGEQPISVPIDNIDGQMIKKLYNIDQTTMSKDLPTKYNQYFTKYSSKAKPESLYLHKCHEAYIHGREGQMLRMFRMGYRFVAFDNDAKAIENALSGKDFNHNHRSVNTIDVYESKYDRTLGGLVMSINSKYMEQVIANISPEVGKISIHDAKNMIENNNTPDKVYDLFHDFIQFRADNFGVKIESCDYARTYFDSENNTLYLRGITDYSKPKSIIDKEVELGNIFRALADMAQKRIGLHNLGLDNLKPEDAKKYSALLSEISAGSHLLQRNLPARISDENKPLIPYWRKELRENPNIKVIIEKGVNNIHEMMTTTKIQKYGENMSVSGVVNRKPRLMTITEDLGGNINYVNHEATIVYDPKKNRADVLLPTGASPYSFNEIAGMEKDVFTKALSAKGINEINFFNRDGYCAMRYPNIYFDKKNIEVVTVKNGNVIKIGDVDVKDEIERTSKVKINNVILIRNDDRRFELCIYPDGEKPLSIEPEFDDIDKFFKILKMPNKNESSLLREAMGQKYYYKAQEHPEIKTSLLEPSVSDEIKNRLDKVVVTKDYNTNKPILIASIDGELQPVTNISVDQYQRMWLVESEEYRSDYKYALASKVFAEKLNLANSEKSDISVDTNDTQEKKPEPVSVQSAKGSVENGEGEEQQDTTPEETIEQDEKKEIRRGGRGR